MNKELVNKLMVSRYLYNEAKYQMNSKTEIALFPAVNLLQDSLEVFLLALILNFNKSIQNGFMGNVKEVEHILNTIEIPFKSSLQRLNKMRVSSKHYCIQPNRQDLEEYLLIAKELYSEITKKLFDVDFFRLTLLDTLEDSESKEFLKIAIDHLENKEHRLCSIECRKAIYLEFEKNYDISQFYTEDNFSEYRKAFSSAPGYAKNRDYIDRNVKEPTDYIVIDHQKLDFDLTKKSIDNIMYWNVWRLTPSLYRFEDGRWAVKEEFDLFEDDFLNENIDYIFNSTVELMYQLQKYKQSLRTKNPVKFSCKIKDIGVNVYAKADMTSEVVYTINNLEIDIFTFRRLDGFIDSERYWYCYFELEDKHVIGYINEKHIV